MVALKSFCVLATLFQLAGHELPAEIEQYLARSKAEEPAALRRFEKQLTAAKQSLGKLRRQPLNPRDPKAKNTKQEMIAAAEAGIADQVERIAGIKTGRNPYLAAVPEKGPAIGQIGKPLDTASHVVQVIDAKNMIITNGSLWPSAPRYALSGTTRENVRFRMIPGKSLMFWIRGWPTKGLTDRRGVDLDTVLRVTGTTTYETVDGGSHTVFVLEPIDVTPYLPVPKQP